MNLIKHNGLILELKNEPDKVVVLTGRTLDTVETIGTTNITLFGTPIEFHIIKNDFLMSPDGMIGRSYLRRERAQISLRHNSLFTISDPINPIPFIDKESGIELTSQSS